MVNANKLSGRIVEAGYTKRRLAKELGISVNTLCSKVNGKGLFNTEEVYRICEILDIRSSNEKVEIFLA